MTQFQQVFSKQITNGPSGCYQLPFDKTVPKYDKILEVVSRLYTDVKDSEYEEDSGEGKQLFP